MVVDDQSDHVGIITVFRRVDNIPTRACHARHTHDGNLEDPHIAPEWCGVREAVTVHKREDASSREECRTGSDWCNRAQVPWRPNDISISVNSTTVCVYENGCPTVNGQLKKKFIRWVK